ncbi:M23 family metallopeptidase [Candidatus Poriferisocius sp.]|uniref:M23 family metallopeptidase n=1 Tax=Candidatus Poriferisocius sp. TaxID=3101276 RepID=UPI003B5C3431
MKKIRHGLRAIRRGLAVSFRWLKKWVVKILGNLKSGRVLLSIAALAVAFVIGIVVSQAWSSDGSDDTPASSAGLSEADSEPTSSPSESDDESLSTDPPTTPEATPASDPSDGSSPSNPPDNTDANPAPTPTPVFVVLDQEPQTYQEALEDAARLSLDIVWPSACMSPLPHPDLLPNAPRTYRSGTHQGVDFRCFARGHPAVAALDGRAVLVVGNYEDPDSDKRDLLLDVAAQLDATPPYTLLTLYGNYVVIDHGVIPDVGHVVTVYAHLESVDPDIRVGEAVQAGQRVGEIGNRGTHAAANGDFYTDPHLHWELHIDNQYLGAGLSAAETRYVYTTLFAETS